MPCIKRVFRYSIRGMYASVDSCESDIFSVPVILALCYLFCAMLSNILSVKLIRVPILNWAVDAGTILYPLSFVVRDMLHKNAGRRLAKNVIIGSGVLTALMAVFIKIAIILPPDPDWPFQQAFHDTLSSTWRLVAAGISVQVIGSLINTAIFSYGLRRWPDKDIAVSFISNGIALFLDTVFFCVFAFSFTYGWDIVAQIIAVNLIFKIFTALIFSPFIRLIKRKVDLGQI